MQTNSLESNDRKTALTPEPPPHRRRRYPRTTDTDDLEATIWRSRRRCTTSRVLNLSEAGMLVTGGDAEVGDVAAFELSGPHFRIGGYAEVAHITGEAMGLRLLGWKEPVNHHIQSLVRQRVHNRRRSQVPGVFLG